MSKSRNHNRYFIPLLLSLFFIMACAHNQQAPVAEKEEQVDL